MKIVIREMLLNARKLAARLLEALQPEHFEARRWPEFEHLTNDQWEDYLYNLPTVWLASEGEIFDFGMDVQHNFLVCREPGVQSFRFRSPDEMHEFLADNEDQQAEQGLEADTEKHIYTYHREPDAPKYSLEQKRAWVVFEYGNFIFLKMPTDADFLRREGIDMQHCLAVAHKDYCQRMQAGELDEYSMVDSRDGLPKVDIEVALTRGSYSHQKIEKPTVTQIRGMRNEMPPKDEYLEAIMAFFQDYGKDWIWSNHGVRNFDGQVDGDRVLRRWQQLQGERASEQA